jgi:hypothetical protein
MTFQFYRKNVYGNETYYPVGEKFEKFVSRFGQTTITHNIFQALEIVGVKVEEVLAPKKLEFYITKKGRVGGKEVV